MLTYERVLPFRFASEIDEFAVNIKKMLMMEEFLLKHYANCDKTACSDHRYLLKLGSRKI